METFKYIFGGLIIAFIYTIIVRRFIEQNDPYKINRKTIDRIIVISQLHIMFILIAVGLTNSLDPFSETNFVNSILDDTFLGKVYDFFSDDRPAPDPYVVAVVEHIKQNKNTFICVGLFLSAVESFGLISRNINRWVIETINIVTSICTLLYLNLLVDTTNLIMSKSIAEGIANYFGQSFSSQLSWIGTANTVTFIALAITHVLSHKALDKYYAPIGVEKPTSWLIGKMVACGIVFLALFYKLMLVPDELRDRNNVQQSEEVNTSTGSSALSAQRENVRQDKETDNIITEEKNARSQKNEKGGNDYKMIMDNIEGWNYLHNSENYVSRTSLECLYASTVEFYGQKMDAYKCVTLFAKMLKKYESFSQKIKGDVSFTKLSDNLIRCDFIKEVETNGIYKDYEAYLVFKKESSWWYIVKESDKTTDFNLKKMNRKKNIENRGNDKIEIINEVQGNYKIYIEWPLFLDGIANVKNVQNVILNKLFEDYNSSDIYECVEKYFRRREKDASLGEGEPEGEIKVQYLGNNQLLYTFYIYNYSDLGGGTGLSVLLSEEFIFYAKRLNRVLTIDDIFSDTQKALDIVNSHISLDEYSNKADKLPDNFYFSNNDVVFVFPKYSIGYGYQGDVKIAINVNEFNGLYSETFRNALKE